MGETIEGLCAIRLALFWPNRHSTSASAPTTDTRQRLPYCPETERNYVELDHDIQIAQESLYAMQELHLEFGNQIALTGFSVQPITAAPRATRFA